MPSYSVLLPNKDYLIRATREADLEAIRGLLTAADLPVVGIDGYINQFLVAENEQVIGVIGIHYDAEKALLRSFVVNPQEQKCGVGTALVTEALQQMKSQQITEVYLLTETAVEYFKRIGFCEISREQMPIHLLAESGLDQVCPCSSCCMKILL